MRAEGMKNATELQSYFMKRIEKFVASKQRKSPKLRANVAAGEKTAIDEYGATNPAEFFAVATESFFERPRDLQQRHPALYEELKRFYQQNPVGWVPAAEVGNGTNRKPTPPNLPPAPERQTDTQE